MDLWEHESLRVFHDGLSDAEDQRTLKRMVTRIKQEHFAHIELAANRAKIKQFGDFLSEELSPSSRPYQEVQPCSFGIANHFGDAPRQVQSGGPLRLLQNCSLMRVFDVTCSPAFLLLHAGSMRQQLGPYGPRHDFHDHLLLHAMSRRCKISAEKLALSGLQTKL